MNTIEIAILLNFISALLMTGVIWFVQIVHYPLFQSVGQSDFTSYEHAHTRRTGYVVGPFMIVELISTVALLFMELQPVLTEIAWLNAALVALVWFVTFTVQVPIHRKLAVVTDRDLIDKLIRSNWIRVFLWTVRAVVALLLLVMSSY